MPVNPLAVLFISLFSLCSLRADLLDPLEEAEIIDFYVQKVEKDCHESMDRNVPIHLLNHILNGSSSRTQLDLPGTVDEHGVREYRSRCLEVRRRYGQSLIHLANSVENLRCVNSSLNRGCLKVDKCLNRVIKERKAFDKVYRKDLFERSHTLKYRWPLHDSDIGKVVSVEIGSERYEFAQGHASQSRLKINLNDEQILIEYRASDQEICMGNVSILVEFETAEGYTRWFSSTYSH